MAEDPGEEITEQHRLGQVRISAGLSRQVLDRWRQVSPTNLEETSTAWLNEALGDLRRSRRQSRELSAAYVRLLRALRTGSTLPPIGPGPRRDSASLGELRDTFTHLAGVHRRHQPDDSVTVTVDDDFDWPEPDEEGDDRAATVSLVTTGPVRAQRQITALQDEEQRGRLDDADFLADLDRVMQDAGALTAGAAGREAQRGGRSLIEDSSRADRKVVGWARVTDSDPCWFCAMLASRGAVYRNAWSARYSGLGRRGGSSMPDGWEDWSPDRLAQWEGEQGLTRYHDHCHCTVVPVYSRTDWVPQQSQAFRELYYQVTEGMNAAEARIAFRRAVETRRRAAQSRGVTVV